MEGEIAAGKWVQLACKRQLEDLERFRRKGSAYRFNPSLRDRSGKRFRPADNVCAFVERLPHIKGPLAGQLIKLEPWQVSVLTTVFGWVKPNGNRRFRRSYVEVPRGNGKSAISSAVGLYMLTADGEGGAEVYSLATTRDQARIVFGDPRARRRCHRSVKRVFDPNWSTTSPVALAQLGSGATFEAGTSSQSAWSYVTTNHSIQARACLNTAYIGIPHFGLGYTPQLPDYQFEVDRANGFA